ncbi:hypothetical protein D3C71_1460440 [compost metagenome]
MSTILAEVNAGANEGLDEIIRTLELTCPAWDAPVYICTGFEDITAVTEDNRTLTFIGANIDIALASKNNKGNQTLAFTVDNTTGEVTQRVDQAIDGNARVTVTYRTYLSGNLTAPAERPYVLSLLSGQIQGVEAQLQTGFFNMIGVAWPRELYTVNEYPALRYI